MRELRIASFLPAATEMVYLLGLGERLVGVTHECDFPPPARKKPVLVDCALDLAGKTAGEIDAAVAECLGSGRSLYLVDEAKLRQAAPNLLITQDLCQVCGPSGNEVSQVLKTLNPPPEVLWQTPKNFADMLSVLRELGRHTGRLEVAEDWAAAAERKVAGIAAKSARLPRRTRVSFIEWVEPLFSGGHWIAQMLHWAGGEDSNAREGQNSARLAWESIRDFQPEVIIVSPCGFKLDKALTHASHLRARPGWSELPAVRQGKVFAVDADSYFARPGPRLVDGVELLAHLIHPQDSAWAGPADAYQRIDERER